MYMFLSDKYQKYIFYAVVMITIGFLLYPSYLPLVDLPQHASQVATFDDWLKGQSVWNNIIQINLDTPYLTSYALWLLLYQFCDIVLSSKLVIIIIFLFYLYTIRLLRLAFHLDRTLDWIALTCFFGFTFQWGFISYLIGIPFGFLHLWAVKRWIDKPKPEYLYVMTCIGILSYFSHILTFAFFCFISYAYFLVAKFRYISWSQRLAFTVPYIIFAVLLLRMVLKPYVIPFQDYTDMGIKQHSFLTKTSAILYLPWHMTTLFEYQLVAIMIFIAPPLLGYRLTRECARYTLLIGTLGIWYIMPDFAYQTFFIYQRFGIFILIFYYMLWEKKATTSKQYQSLIQLASVLFIVSICALMIKVYSNTIYFANSPVSSEFNNLLNHMKSNKRVMYIVDREGVNEDSITSIRTYLHFGQWYQALKHGWVDYSFATAPAMIVRLNPKAIYSGYNQNRVLDKESIAEKTQCQYYDYLLIHTHTIAFNNIKNWLAMNPTCQNMQLLYSNKEWGLYGKPETKQ